MDEAPAGERQEGGTPTGGRHPGLVLLWVASTAGAVGCGSDPAPPPPPPSSDLATCDLRQVACQQAVYDAVQAARDGEAGTAPPVRFITREELREQLMADVPEEEAVAVTVALQLLGLIATDSTVDGAMAEDAAEFIAAYYQPSTRSITFVEDAMADRDEGLYVMAHEMVHAAQDDEGALAEVWDGRTDTTDGELAGEHLIEGEATHYGFVALARVLDGGADDVDWDGLYGDWADDTAAFVAGAPNPFAAVGSLAYPVGARLVAREWAQGDVAAVRALYQAHPRHTLGWMDGEGDATPEPLDCEPPLPPAGFEAAIDDVMGAEMLFAFLGAAGMPVDDAWQEAQGWRNDRFAVYADPSSGTTAAAWRVRWADEAQAAAFAAGVLGTAPPFGAIEADADGSEVLVVASDEPDLLDAWPASACPAVPPASTALRLPRAPRRE
ncbi:MAG: hypothetical protein ACODAU_04825 [Myxococcota bacterium]